jgi:Ca-activated chloride channel family protein
MKRFWILVFLILPAALIAGQQSTLKVNVDLVNVLFTVTDGKGRLVSGLTKEDFLIEEDGRKQEIYRFSRENELPLTLGLLVDTSASVSRVFGDEKETAINFLESTLKSGDLAFVIGFERFVTLAEDFTDDPRRLRTAINSLVIGQGTSIYDAVYLACKEMLDKESGRKAIILISDGQDTTSKVRFNEALLAAYNSDAVIFSISNRIGGFFDIRGTGSPETLREFSSETGGTVFFVGGRSDLTRVFEQIAAELRSQYSLAYVSSNPARDGKYRKIRIIPRDPGFKIKARSGYYAPTR